MLNARNLTSALLVIGSLALPLGTSQAADGLETENQKFSYAIGVQIGEALMKRGYSDVIDLDIFRAAIEDVIRENELKLSLEERNAVVFKMQQAAAAKQAEETMNAGLEFLKENGARDAVTTLDSGLQYEVLKEGGSGYVTDDDTAVLHYEGTLIDGTVFDSSYKRGEPAEFPVGGLIPGFTEALLAMPIGSKWKVYIPSDLAYGPQGAGRDIGPNETLIFTIELLAKM